MKWINGELYPCKKMGSYPQMYVERVMHDKYKGVAIRCFEVKGMPGYTISMTNSLARTLVKKIMLALEAKPLL